MVFALNEARQHTLLRRDINGYPNFVHTLTHQRDAAFRAAPHHSPHHTPPAGREQHLWRAHRWRLHVDSDGGPVDGAAGARASANAPLRRQAARSRGRGRGQRGDAHNAYV